LAVKKAGIPEMFGALHCLKISPEIDCQSTSTFPLHLFH
jgi:hypothetical protein